MSQEDWGRAPHHMLHQLLVNIVRPGREAALKLNLVVLTVHSLELNFPREELVLFAGGGECCS